MTTLRPAAVAGTFYPGTAASLQSEVWGYLRGAPAGRAACPKAVIVPHAGYVYSGPIAAAAYSRVAELRGRVQRVLLLGPAHRVALRGLALPGVDAFETPLGRVAVDAAALRMLQTPQVIVHRGAHAAEHSLEVQLPFLQETLGSFSLVPLVVGEASADEVAAVLEALWGGPETLVVISSDLSHYLPYELAQRTDVRTAQAITALEPTLDHAQACGATPVNGLLAIARRRGMRTELLDLRNSGDTAGDRARVVGYGAIAFYESGTAEAERDQAVPASTEQQSRRSALLGVARAAIAERFGVPATIERAVFLRAPGASFVTLRRSGELRGCVGSLEAHRPLGEDVQHNARAAAFADPRFAPLARHEFEQVRIDVSVLSTPQPIAAANEAVLRAQLRPHVDGLILRYGDRRATFLPKVWEALPDAREFIAQLRRKAGLPAGFWHEDLQIVRYTVDTYAETRT